MRVAVYMENSTGVRVSNVYASGVDHAVVIDSCTDTHLSNITLADKHGRRAMVPVELKGNLLDSVSWLAMWTWLASWRWRPGRERA